MTELVIFLGPTARRSEISAILDAGFRPPVRQGDIFRAVEGGARGLGIVDGYFDSTQSVWHKEILWAIDQGVPVFGAASMGALRAAELAPFGMRGVGWVFEAFRSGRLEDDDEVAIIHAPERLDFKPVSEAMVNVRCTLEQGVADGVLAREAALEIERSAKALYYADRDWPRILEEASSALDHHAVGAFRAWLPTGRVDIKRRDAIALAHAMKRHFDRADPADPVDAPPACHPVRYEATALVESARRMARIEDASAPAIAPTAALLIDECRLADPRWLAAEDMGLLEALVTARAAAAGAPLDEDALLGAIAAFREDRAREGEEDVGDWLGARGLSEQALLAMLARGVRLRQAREELAPLASQMLRDRALLRPDAPALVERAADKRRRLDLAISRGALPACDLDGDRLLEWYETASGVSLERPIPPERIEALTRTLRREYQYRRLCIEPRIGGGAAGGT